MEHGWPCKNSKSPQDGTTTGPIQQRRALIHQTQKLLTAKSHTAKACNRLRAGWRYITTTATTNGINNQQQWTHHGPSFDPTTSVIANGTASARNNKQRQHDGALLYGTALHYAHQMHNIQYSTLEYPSPECPFYFTRRNIASKPPESVSI